MAIMLSTIIGIGIRYAAPDGHRSRRPRRLDAGVGRGGVVAIILSVVISGWGLCFGKTVVEYSGDIITKPLGIIFRWDFYILRFVLRL